jgi:hypothetical protein
MALEFDFSISTELEPLQVLQILAKQFNLGLDSGQLRENGVAIFAISKTTLGQSVIEEGFGFKPTISVGFRITAKDNYEQGKLTILQATIELMSKLKGDCILLFNGEELLLQRIGEKLLINQDKSIWKTSQIAEITLPYQLCSISSPLL